MHGDGRTFEVLPLSVFRLRAGGTVIRIGRTTYWFNENGRYDGPEFQADGAMPEAEQKLLAEALAAGKHNRDRAPETAYFAEGTPGHASETAIWPKPKGQN
jgi:hypothetical protein